MVRCLAAIDRVPATLDIYHGGSQCSAVYALPSYSQQLALLAAATLDSVWYNKEWFGYQSAKTATSKKSQLKSVLQTINMCFACVDDRDSVTNMGYDNASDIDAVDNR